MYFKDVLSELISGLSLETIDTHLGDLNDMTTFTQALKLECMQFSYFHCRQGLHLQAWLPTVALLGSGGKLSRCVPNIGHLSHVLMGYLQSHSIFLLLLPHHEMAAFFSHLLLTNIPSS